MVLVFTYGAHHGKQIAHSSHLQAFGSQVLHNPLSTVTAWHSHRTGDSQRLFSLGLLSTTHNKNPTVVSEYLNQLLISEEILKKKAYFLR